MNGATSAPMTLVPIAEVETELQTIRSTAEPLLEKLEHAGVERVTGGNLTMLYRDIEIAKLAAVRGLEILEEARRAA